MANGWHPSILEKCKLKNEGCPKTKSKIKKSAQYIAKFRIIYSFQFETLSQDIGKSHAEYGLFNNGLFDDR